jgi:hypothetical protein
MTYSTPDNIPTLSYPIGIDKAIQNLQVELGENLSWLQYSFGRAYVGKDRQQGGRDYVYPAVYKGNSNYYDASPNDNVVSQSFFLIDGEYQYSDYQINSDNLFNVPVSLIVWGNLKKISDTDEHFEHILLQDLLKVINENGDFIIRGVVDNETDVFSEFTDRLENSELFYYPYFCYRIKMVASSLEECRTDIDFALNEYKTI